MLTNSVVLFQRQPFIEYFYRCASAFRTSQSSTGRYRLAKVLKVRSGVPTERVRTCPPACWSLPLRYTFHRPRLARRCFRSDATHHSPLPSLTALIEADSTATALRTHIRIALPFRTACSRRLHPHTPAPHPASPTDIIPPTPYPWVGFLFALLVHTAFAYSSASGRFVFSPPNPLPPPSPAARQVPP